MHAVSAARQYCYWLGSGCMASIVAALVVHFCSHLLDTAWSVSSSQCAAVRVTNMCVNCSQHADQLFEGMHHVLSIRTMTNPGILTRSTVFTAPSAACAAALCHIRSVDRSSHSTSGTRTTRNRAAVVHLFRHSAVSGRHCAKCFRIGFK